MQNVVNVKSVRKANALMKRAHAWAESKQTRIQVQCVLDDGSQRSFIRHELVEALGLQVLHEEILTVQGFGGYKNAYRKFPVVKVRLREPHEQKYVCDLNLLVVPELQPFLCVKWF